MITIVRNYYWGDHSKADPVMRFVAKIPPKWQGSFYSYEGPGTQNLEYLNFQVLCSPSFLQVPGKGRNRGQCQTHTLYYCEIPTWPPHRVGGPMGRIRFTQARMRKRPWNPSMPNSFLPCFILGSQMRKGKSGEIMLKNRGIWGFFCKV